MSLVSVKENEPPLQDKMSPMFKTLANVTPLGP